MSYGWSAASTPSEEPLHEHDVVTPQAAAGCKIVTTKVDEDLYILTLTLDRGGRLTMQGSRAALRAFSVRLMLTFTVAVDEEERMRREKDEA